MPVRLIVTRPQPEADRWVAQLRERGIDAVALPLIAIQSAPEPQLLVDAWHRLASYRAVMFVSAAAVRHFFAARPPAGADRWPCAAWATGPGTAHALIAHGVPPTRVAQPPADAVQFDSEALWAVVHGSVQPGQRVLIVRGAGADGAPAGRDWLASRLAGAGVQVDAVAAYRRAVPHWTDAQRAHARSAASGPVAWLFSSSEAVGNLASLAPAQSWTAARAIATHGRIAQAAREAGFGVVCLSRPAVEAVAAALESFG